VKRWVRSAGGVVAGASTQEVGMEEDGSNGGMFVGTFWTVVIEGGMVAAIFFAVIFLRGCVA